jgi:asparagine synthase (glutamine-hydrolysing)
MCGFLGQCNTTPLPEGEFKAILALGKHRGPDQTGYWVNPQTQLGFNRLSILDLTDAGNQPMKSPNEKFMVVFNGEIYNHLEIRKRLPSYEYKGTSDTETLTFALEIWGIEKTINAIDGMFAIGIYDILDESLYLVRDFAGIKPLFFGQKGKAIVFASQYDQITQHPLFSNAAIQPQVLRLYLEQHFIPAPFGLHQGTAQLKPGEIIRFDKDGNKKHIRYWELPAIGDGAIKDKTEAQKHISKMLEECVNDQLVADVAVGAFLSGGVDSPLICAKAVNSKSDLKVFSIGSDSQVHDESERSKQFAEALGVNQFLWKLDAKEMFTHWSDAIKCLHEPFADFSLLPTFLVSKLAKQYVKVALSGDGGDELFFGYERFWSVGKNITFQHWPSLVRKALYGFDKYTTGNKRLNSVLLSNSQSSAHQGLHSRFNKKWLNKIAPDLASVSLPEEFDTYNYSNTKNERELIGYMRKAEFYGMMQKTLRKVDLASMQNSLEVRVPFLQKKIIEASLQIDPLLSYSKGNKKQILKELLQTEFPGMEDDNIKRGFTIPLAKWIKEDLKSVFEEKLLDGNFEQIGFEKKSIERMLQAHHNGIVDYKWPLFTMYALSETLGN